MPEPDWHEPRTVQEAVRLRRELGEDAIVVAGGTFTGILVNQRLIQPRAFISLAHIEGLDRIEAGEELRLGAMVSHRSVERSHEIRNGWGCLADAFAVVASPRVRNQATVGGVLCDADYASDPPCMFVALDARVRLVGSSGSRELPVERFITGHYATDLRADELLVEVVVPRPPGRATYVKFRSRSSEDRPCVAVAATAAVDPDGSCRDLRVVAGAVADHPLLLREACELARGRRLDSTLGAEIGRAYAEGVDAIADVRGSAAYRRRVLAVIVRRAIEALAA